MGGDGTLNGLQPLADRLPTVLAPKTIDNDLGLNYPDEPERMGTVHELNTRRTASIMSIGSRRRFLISNIL